MRELVTSKITKVLSECFILRSCNNDLGLLRDAVLVNVFLHHANLAGEPQEM